MEYEKIFSNPYIAVVKNSEEVYIESFTKGMSFQNLAKSLEDYPEIRITNHSAIKRALHQAPHPLVKFGELKKRVDVEISGDGLSAYITLYVREEELNQLPLIREIVVELNKLGIVFGIKKSVLFERALQSPEAVDCRRGPSNKRRGLHNKDVPIKRA